MLGLGPLAELNGRKNLGMPPLLSPKVLAAHQMLHASPTAEKPAQTWKDGWAYSTARRQSEFGQRYVDCMQSCHAKDAALKHTILCFAGGKLVPGVMGRVPRSRCLYRGLFQRSSSIHDD